MTWRMTCQVKDTDGGVSVLSLVFDPVNKYLNNIIVKKKLIVFVALFSVRESRDKYVQKRAFFIKVE